MVYAKTIVCFANSRKTSGRCIAGKSWINNQSGEWIRPISERPTHEFHQEDLFFKDGTKPQLLDIIRLPCKKYEPMSHQKENHVIDMGFYWQHLGRFPFQAIGHCLDNPDTLWETGKASYSGINNRIAYGQEDGTSLFLIAVDKLRLLIGLKSDFSDAKRTVRGEFMYRGITYRMDVTDPVIERNFLARPDGQYDIASPILCISLSDPYQGYFYKLIAAILFQERFK